MQSLISIMSKMAVSTAAMELVTSTTGVSAVCVVRVSSQIRLSTVALNSKASVKIFLDFMVYDVVESNGRKGLKPLAPVSVYACGGRGFYLTVPGVGRASG